MEIDNLKSLPKTIGAKQTSKAIVRGEVKLVFLANDSEERIVQPIRALCEEHAVPVNIEYSMEELGKACRIKVKAAAVGVLA